MYHAFVCSLDLALTYSLRRKTRRLAWSLADDAFRLAHRMNRPDLMCRANDLLASL